MTKKQIKKLGLMIFGALILSTLINQISFAYEIPSYFRPENLPFGFTDNIEGTDNASKASTGTILILQIIAGGLLYFAAPIAVISLVIAGIIMITGGDDPDKLGQSKKAIAYTVVGLICIMLSYSIVRIALNIILKVADNTI